MELHTILIIGDSIFAETLAETLIKTNQVAVLAVVPSLEAARAQLVAQAPDIVVIAGITEVDVDIAGPLLSTSPDLAIIRAGLDMDNIQVITSHSIGRRVADLIEAIEKLPRRS